MNTLVRRIAVLAFPLLLADVSQGGDAFVASEAIPGTDGGYYALPKLYLPLSLVRDGCKLAVTREPEMYLPDGNARYRLKIDHSWLSTDTLTVETDPNGLLKSVNGTSVDETPAIAKKTVQIIAGFQGVKPAGGPTSNGDPKVTEFDCNSSKLGNFKYRATIDPTQSAVLVNRDIAGTGVKISVNPLDEGAPPPEEKVDCGEVVCFRAHRPYVVSVEQAATSPKLGNFPFQSFRYLVLAPDPNRVLTVRLDRQLFATANVALTFKNGMLTGYDTTKESEALSLLQVPLDVASQLIALPGQVLSVKVEEVGRDLDFVRKQEALLKAQAQLVEAQQKALADQQARSNKPNGDKP